MVLLLTSAQSRKGIAAPSKPRVPNMPRVARTNGRRVSVIFILAIILGVLVINSYVFLYSQKFILASGQNSPFGLKALDRNLNQESAETVPNVSENEIPVAVILGASVYSDGTLSPALKERAETGFDLYEKGIVRKIIISGDNRRPSYNEVSPMRAYLVEKNVPSEDLFSDFAGFDTYDSMYRAGRIFGAKNVLVVTQSFHLPRAVYAARKVGLNAYGVPAGTKVEQDAVIARAEKFYLKDSARESVATIKTFIEVLTHAKPAFLGRAIPIEGDGRKSLE